VATKKERKRGKRRKTERMVLGSFQLPFGDRREGKEEKKGIRGKNQGVSHCPVSLVREGEKKKEKRGEGDARPPSSRPKGGRKKKKKKEGKEGGGVPFSPIVLHVLCRAE